MTRARWVTSKGWGPSDTSTRRTYTGRRGGPVGSGRTGSRPATVTARCGAAAIDGHREVADPGHCTHRGRGARAAAGRGDVVGRRAAPCGRDRHAVGAARPGAPPRSIRPRATPAGRCGPTSSRRRPSSTGRRVAPLDSTRTDRRPGPAEVQSVPPPAMVACARRAGDQRRGAGNGQHDHHDEPCRQGAPAAPPPGPADGRPLRPRPRRRCRAPRADRAGRRRRPGPPPRPTR